MYDELRAILDIFERAQQNWCDEPQGEDDAPGWRVALYMFLDDPAIDNLAERLGVAPITEGKHLVTVQGSGTQPWGTGSKPYNLVELLTAAVKRMGE